MQGPCVSIPVLHGPHGLPIGLQVVGGRHADDALLRTCGWLMAALAP
jgi:Asp-tRNA(Asn)/Glu-tRNA(Gln) amidotransferase A subunit family amidase